MLVHLLNWKLGFSFAHSLACWNVSNMPSRVPCSNFCQQLPLSEKVVTPFSTLLGFLILRVMASTSSSQGSVFWRRRANSKSSTGVCFIFCITYCLFPSQNLSQPIWYCFISSLFMLACVFIISFLFVISNILQSLHFLHVLLKLQHAGVQCRDGKIPSPDVGNMKVHMPA